MKINSVTREYKNSNRYCAPAVLSALTKLDTRDTAKAIRDITGKRAVMGVHESDILKTLREHYNFNVEVLESRSRRAGETNKSPTLTQWLKSTKEIRTSGRVFLLVAGRHYQLISGRRYVCGLTKDIVSIKSKKVKRRARVTFVAEVKH